MGGNPILRNDPNGDQAPATVAPPPSTPLIEVVTDALLNYFGGPIGKAIVLVNQTLPSPQQRQQMAAARAEHERLAAKETRLETFKRVWGLSDKKEEQPIRAANPYLNKSKTELEKSKATFEDLITEHEDKLDEYKRDPEKYDNKNILKGKSEDVKKQIIQGRVKSLEKQIVKQKGELQKVVEALKTK